MYTRTGVKAAVTCLLLDMVIWHVDVVPLQAPDQRLRRPSVTLGTAVSVTVVPVANW